MLDSGPDEPQAPGNFCRQLTRVSKITFFSQLEPFAKRPKRIGFSKFQMPSGSFFNGVQCFVRPQCRSTTKDDWLESNIAITKLSTSISWLCSILMIRTLASTCMRINKINSSTRSEFFYTFTYTCANGSSQIKCNGINFFGPPLTLVLRLGLGRSRYAPPPQA